MKKEKICEFLVHKLQEKYSEKEIQELLNDAHKFSSIVNSYLLDLEVTQKIIKNKKKFLMLNESKQLKKILELKLQTNEKRKYIYEEAGQHYSTGINFLSDIMGQIRGKLVEEYKKLTTSYKQRESFKIHILNGIVNMFATEFLNSDRKILLPGAEKFYDRVKKLEDTHSNFQQEEGKRIKTGKETGKEKIITIDKGSKEDIERMRFVIPNTDKTGANAAYNLFKQIKKQILDKYNLLDNEQDKKDFYEYLLANVEAELNAAEEELRADLPEDKVKEIYNNMPKNAKEVNQENASQEQETEFEESPTTEKGKKEPPTETPVEPQRNPLGAI